MRRDGCGTSAENTPSGLRGPDRLLLEALGPIDRQRDAGPVRHERAADRPAVLPGLSRGSLAGVGIPRVEALVPQAEIDPIAPAVAARLRANLDARAFAAAIRARRPIGSALPGCGRPAGVRRRRTRSRGCRGPCADQLFKHLRELGRIVGQSTGAAPPSVRW